MPYAWLSNVSNVSNTDLSTCHDALAASVGPTSTAFVVVGCVQIATSLSLLIYVYALKLQARNGCIASAHSLVLPVYLWVLVVFTIADVVQGVISIAINVAIDADYDRQEGPLVVVSWALFHFVIGGLQSPCLKTLTTRGWRP